jgi:radical SAM protein with 4Fe4S-binding SPASM domain
MPFSLFKRIADELFPYSKFVDLRGFGESTILPNFLDYVNYALKYDCDIGILTNLSVSNDKMWEHLISNNYWIGISIDGPDKETYSRIREASHFGQVISNIKLLVRLSRKFKKDIKRLYLLVVVQKDNVEHLTDFIELACKLGIKRVEFKPVRSNDSNIWLQDIQDLTRNEVKKAVQLAKKHGIDLIITGSFFDTEFEQSMGLKPMDRCPRPWSHLYIAYNGFVGPCNHRHDLLFGNLKYWMFNEIWNSGHYQLFRKIINTSNRPDRCDECFTSYFDNEWS